MKVGGKQEGLQGRSFGTIGSWLVMAAAAIAIGVAILRGTGMLGDRPEPSDQPTDLVASTQPHPDDGEANSRRAARYFDSGQFDKAAQAYGEALRLAPGNASLWSARGEAWVMAGRHEPLPAAALSDFETAIRLEQLAGAACRHAARRGVGSRLAPHYRTGSQDQRDSSERALGQCATACTKGPADHCRNPRPQR